MNPDHSSAERASASMDSTPHRELLILKAFTALIGNGIKGVKRFLFAPFPAAITPFFAGFFAECATLGMGKEGGQS